MLAVGEEVFGAGGGGGEDGAAAGHGLALDEGEALFDAGQDEEVAGAHFFCELCLRERAGEDDVIGGQGGEKGADVVLNGAGDGEVFVRVLEAGEGLEEIGDAFAQADLTGEEDLEGVLRRVFGAGEVIEADAVGNDVDLFRGDSHCNEGTLGYGGGYGDGVGERVDLFFADGDVGLAEGLG